MKRSEFVNFLTPKKALQLQLAGDGMDGTMTEINDSFMTADESNNTQFFSVLEESNAETILDDITYDQINDADFTFTNDDAQGADNKEESSVAGVDNELVIFKSPHSSKMFGLQTITDDEGNLQKYQYEVLQNEEGQFETVPETLQIVPFETDPETVIQQMEAHMEEEMTNCPLATSEEDPLGNQAFISNLGVKLENQNFQDDLYMTLDQEQPDLKHLVLEDNLRSSDIPDHISQNQINEQFHDLCLSLENDVKPKMVIVSENPLQDRYIPGYGESEARLGESDLASSEEFQEQELESIVKSENVATNETGKQCILESALKGIYSPVKSENQHFYTEEIELETPDEIQILEEPIKETIALPKINAGGMRTIALYPIPKDMIKARNKVITTIELPRRAKPLKTLNTQKRESVTTSTVTPNAVIVSPQKENLEIKSSLELLGQGISIIKRNNIKRTLNKPEPVAFQSIGEKIETAKASTSAQGESKEKKKNPTWNVNKMISQTKIIEAPIRHERLPRKQKIKPLSRVGEELVFQHVTVTANGMVETKVDGVVQELKVLQPSECIQLSDTEDDFTWKSRKKSKKQKKIEIIISDSEEETVMTETEVQIEKTTHGCIKCDKVFPSVGSLNTHLQHHYLEEKKQYVKTEEKQAEHTQNLPNKENQNDDKSEGTEAVKTENKTSKYSCPTCSETFINAFLRSKHLDMHKSRTKHECPECKRLFPNLKALNTHKKEHKQNIPVVKSKSSEGQPELTSQDDKKKRDEVAKKLSVRKSVFGTVSKPAASPTVTVRRRSMKLSSMHPPRKSMLLQPSVGMRKSILPPKPRQSIAPSTSTTATPKRTSVALNKFKCTTCSNTFPSKVTLDSHRVSSCVKSPRKSAKMGGPLNKTMSAPSTVSKLTTGASAKAKFKSSSTFSLNSSISSSGASTKKVRLSARHRIPTNAGIPVNHSMRKAFNNLKRKLDGNDLDSDEFGTVSNTESINT